MAATARRPVSSETGAGWVADRAVTDCHWLSPRRPAPRSDGATEAGRARSRVGSAGTAWEQNRADQRERQGETRVVGRKGVQCPGEGRVKGYSAEGSPQSADYVKST